MATRKPTIDLKLPGDKLTQVQRILDSLLLTDEQVKLVMTTLYDEMRLGMSKDPEERKKTSLQMENTYVRSLLDGTEEGDYLALDLGGTNFRVLLVKMSGGKCESISRNYNVPTPLLYGPAEKVFDHLAESIYKFLTEEKLLDKRLPLGFTFSFPMVQESIKCGILITWTKSFSCPDGVGQDAVKMLEKSISNYKIKVDVVAVLNDTTGTLMAGSYLDKQCLIGLIMGTGCNGAYLEDLENVDKWVGEKTEPKHVIIDTECGAFGDNGSLDFIKTKYDGIIDEHSNHVGSFTFEKLFSGHYVGDLVRVVLHDIAEQYSLFDNNVRGKLAEWKSITAADISEVERKGEDGARALLSHLGVTDPPTDADVSIIRYLCSVVCIRGAQLVAATISVFCNHMKREEMTVAIDGSLYKHHPYLHDIMTAWCAELAPNTKTKFILAEDGSGRGAAFVAAVAVKQAAASVNKLAL